MQKAMNTLKTFTLIAVILGCSTTAWGQQEAIYAHFVNHQGIVNPAYTGYREAANVSVIHRSQWVGFKGAPNTDYVIFDTPLRFDELALGGSFMYDKIGPTSEVALTMDAAYRLRLSNKTTLSFGLKGSMSMYQVNLTDLDLISDYYGSNDDLFATNPRSMLLPNVGAGVFYNKTDWFIGVSVPRMLRYTIGDKQQTVYEGLTGKTEPTAYLSGGKTFKIDRDYKIKVTSLTRATAGAPLSTGFFTSLLIMDQIDIGGFYFFKEVAGLYFNWSPTKKWSFGYSADFATNALISTNYGSHEIMVNYYLKGKRKRIVYPRYF